MIDKRFIGKVPQNREGKREPSGDSVKNRRNQIEVLTREINDLREKIRLDRYKDVDIFSKVKEIEKRKKRLEFTLMSKEEQDALLLYIQELQNKVNVLSEEKDNDKDAYGIEGRKRFILALSELQREKNGLPEKVLKEFLDKNTEKTQEYENNFEARFEETAKEAINHGVARLAKSLLEIKEKTGSLPTVVLYPETTSRPLRYAIKPLLDKIYSEASQKLPGEFFVKTYSGLIKEDDHIRKVEEMKKKINLLNEERIESINESEKLLRLLKSSSKKEKETLSTQIDSLWQKIQKINQDIFDQKEHVGSFEDLQFKQVTEDRIKNILKTTSSGPILIVDDVVGYGRTFSGLEENLTALNRQKDANYFAFISLGDSVVRNLSVIDMDRISIGVGSYHSNNEEDYKDRTGFVLPETDEETGLEWGELQMRGFPFRKDKEETTGVKKDQESLNPFVERSDNADFKKMKAVRTKYLNWGKEAVEKL